MPLRVRLNDLLGHAFAGDGALPVGLGKDATVYLHDVPQSRVAGQQRAGGTMIQFPPERGFMARKRSVFDGWDEFGMAVVMHMLFPLVPLLLEFVLKQRLTAGTLTLSLAMYSFAIANSTRLKFSFSTFVLIGFIAGVFYGVSEAKELPDSGHQAAWSALVLVFVAHALERFQRHVLRGELFLEFMRKR